MKNKMDETEGDGKDKPKEPETTPETRLDNMEKSIGQVKGDISKILSFVEKNMKKEDDDNDEDKPKDYPDMDKKKDDGVGVKDVNPNPEGGDVKLPKAPAGETDETAPIAGDKGDSLVEKKLAEMQKSFDKKVSSAAKEIAGEIIKEMGLKKSTTPRGQHEATDIIKKNNEAKQEFALDIIKRSKEGNLSMADMNRETKDFVKSQYETKISAFMKQGDK